MKKYFLSIFILTLMLFSPGIVKAESTIDILQQEYIKTSSTFSGSCSKVLGYYYTDFNKFISDSRNSDIFNELYDNVVSIYKDKYEGIPYKTSVNIISSSNDSLDLKAVIVIRSIFPNFDTSSFNDTNARFLVSYYFDGTYYKNYDVSYTELINDVFDSDTPIGRGCVDDKYIVDLSSYSIHYYNAIYYNPTLLFDSTMPDDYTINSGYSVNLYSSENNLIGTYKSGDRHPVLFPDGYDSSSPSNYTTVDLSKYHYVLLSLKDYSKKEAFSTNLQVKGMVGITPIYNYGTTAKDDVIGNKIEDRCNLSYKDYTDYRLYIIKSDLENKSIYAVKSCEDNSSFKFDNTLFDITYVTDDNVDDPVVVIGGKEYHVIPYNQLPSTATQNEEENYVPGESKELSFSEIVDNVTDTLSSVWSSIITFMNLFTKFFNTLPVEIRVISITTFTTACTLGIIKILKS